MSGVNFPRCSDEIGAGSGKIAKMVAEDRQAGAPKLSIETVPPWQVSDGAVSKKGRNAGGRPRIASL